MNCSNCVHYGIYKMITSGKPYGYAGDIPCIRCSEYKMNSEFVSVIIHIVKKYIYLQKIYKIICI